MLTHTHDDLFWAGISTYVDLPFLDIDEGPDTQEDGGALETRRVNVHGDIVNTVQPLDIDPPR